MGVRKKIVIVMPAYNAERTLIKTFKAIPNGIADLIILVDDASKDRTVKIAKKLPIKVVVHQKNKGYGGNQKTCYDTALSDGAEIIVMLHPDYQYDPSKIPELIEPIKNNKADVVYGSRMLMRGNAAKGGMPFYKRLGNLMLTIYMNTMLKTEFTDGATGFIAYSRTVLKSIRYHDNSDGFTFDEEAIIQCAAKKFRMKEIPITTAYNLDSSSISFGKSVRYGMFLFFKILQYKLHQYRIIKVRQFQ